MTVFLLFDNEKQANWQPIYEATYVRTLAEKDFDFKCESFDFYENWRHNLKPGDVLWPMHYKHLSYPGLKDFANHYGVKIIFRVSGTAANPECYQVDFETERNIVENIVDVNMVFGTRMQKFMQERYPDGRFEPIGYPIQVPKHHSNPVKKPRIVIGGRLSPDKQPMLAMRLLKNQLKTHREIVFAYPDNKGKDTNWMNSYGGFARYEALGFKFLKMDKDEWLRYIGESEIYFTCSLGDTACVSMIEALELGAYVVYPKFGEGLPVYDTYVKGNGWYTPFSFLDVDYVISSKQEQTYDDTDWNVEKWYDRFSEMIRTIND